MWGFQTLWERFSWKWLQRETPNSVWHFIFACETLWKAFVRGRGRGRQEEEEEDKKRKRRRRGRKEEEEEEDNHLGMIWHHSGAHLGIIWSSFLSDFWDWLARWSQMRFEGTRAILTRKTHAIVRAPPISLQSGEPRTLKHCKNTYKMSVQNRPAAGIGSTGP